MLMLVRRVSAADFFTQNVRSGIITARKIFLGLASSLFICRDMTFYQQTPSRQLEVSEDLMGSGGELLAVPGTKKQGGSVVLASLRKKILNFLSSKTCHSAYFGFSYNMSVAKLQLILLCLGFLLSTESPSLL